jgi:replication factor C subunit 3/5
MTSNGIPLIEFYRPKNLENIVLNHHNREILKNIIDKNYFPNLLLYGPPGTGKTTTIINLINCYQEKCDIKNKNLIIHLNASDDRGIDIIRNQINSFVNSKPLFNNGMKFVILDEVDYMTKNAQQALRYLLQIYTNNVRFCLMCNYISKIDDCLQNEFVCLRFNQLPEKEITNFLQNICTCEKIHLSKDTIQYIQKLYKSDIRSMINFIQLNQDINNDDIDNNIKIINNEVFEQFYQKIKEGNITNMNHFIYYVSNNYNINHKNFIKDFLNYIIQNYTHKLNSEFLNFMENLIHSKIENNNIYINYLTTNISSFLS